MSTVAASTRKSNKAFYAHVYDQAAYSARRLPLIPVEPCHRFQAKVATDSD